MNAVERRAYILNIIEEQTKPVSASALAKQCKVSRQLIVGDVALLRAAGHRIIATPRGYLMDQKKEHEIDATIAVVHRKEDLRDELETIVAHGGSVLDVIVEHPLYGQLCGSLHIHSIYDVEQFLKKCESENALPLSSLTNGVHLHTIRVRDEAALKRIQTALNEKGYLF